MPLSESLNAQAQRETQSVHCVCGNDKKSGNPFCKRCYWRLPKELRMDLQRTNSEGFGSAYSEARDWCRCNP